MNVYKITATDLDDIAKQLKNLHNVSDGDVVIITCTASDPPTMSEFLCSESGDGDKSYAITLCDGADINTKHWSDNFVRQDGDEWVAYDETQAEELGRRPTREGAVALVAQRAEELESSGYYDGITGD